MTMPREDSALFPHAQLGWEHAWRGMRCAAPIGFDEEQAEVYRIGYADGEDSRRIAEEIRAGKIVVKATPRVRTDAERQRDSARRRKEKQRARERALGDRPAEVLPAIPSLVVGLRGGLDEEARVPDVGPGDAVVGERPDAGDVHALPVG